MARKKFWVDWSDSSFPQIKIHNFGDYKYGPDPMTFADAKRDVLDKCDQEISHWKAVAADFRALRRDDVTADDTGDYR